MFSTYTKEEPRVTAADLAKLFRGDSQMARRVREFDWSDIRLPDMNGYQLMQRFKDLDGLGRAIFIALSGYGEDDAPGRGSVEFDYFIQKPLKIEQLDSFLYSISISAAPSPCAGEAISGAVRELLS
jgi:CheY-like chemotaxis protein